MPLSVDFNRITLSACLFLTWVILRTDALPELNTKHTSQLVEESESFNFCSSGKEIGICRMKPDCLNDLPDSYDSCSSAHYVCCQLSSNDKDAASVRYFMKDQSNANFNNSIKESRIKRQVSPPRRRPGPAIWRPGPNESRTTTASFQRDCGINMGTPAPLGITSLIIGGVDADVDNYPWMAAMMVRDAFTKTMVLNCGGTLIHPLFVLSAAHCLENWSPAETTWRFRANDIKKEVGETFSVAVDRNILHPQYRRTAAYHDIALSKLKARVTHPKVIPVCLPNTNEAFEGASVEVIGYGSTKFGSEAADRLKKVGLTVSTTAECQAEYKGQRKLSQGITKNIICAGGPGKDACQGDSGGPLLYRVNDKTRIIGVVSTGIGCGQVNGIYTRVSEYSGWILRNTK